MAKQTIDELAVIISANSTKLGPDLARAKKEFDKFSKGVQGSTAPPPKPPDMRAHRQAVKEATDARRSVAEASGSVLGFVAKVAATGGSLVALEMGLSGVAGAFGQLKDSVRMAAELEQTKLGFEVMLGDAREATQLVADVRKYAASTPFNTGELTGSTRQLIAYGRSADTAMQDLKMLGDVSAAFGDSLPISELTYLYGTLFAQQRAFTKDLYQFAGRGIPIWDELAKVTGKTGAELRDMVEDGRIGFAEVETAFKRMTSEGGRFYGMTARQGQTVAGVLEQMKDGFELLKIEVGQVLIEELGIKQGARDLEAFATRLRENVGVLRPAVKLAGSLARAATQVGHEFARAGIKQIGDTIREMIDGAGTFKLDERAMIDFAFGFGKAMSTNVAQLGKQVGEFGEGLIGAFEWVLKAARESRDFMAETAAFLKSINDALPSASKFLNPGALAGGVMGIAQARQADLLRGRRPGDPIDRFQLPPPMPGIDPDRVREEWAALATAAAQLSQQLDRERREVEAGRLRPGFLRGTEEQLAGIRGRQDAYAGAFEGERGAVRRRLDAGDIPTIRGAADAAAKTDFLAQLQKGLDAVRGPLAILRSWDGGALSADLERGHKRAIAALDARTAAERAAAEATAQRAAVMAAHFGPAAVLQTPADVAANRRAQRSGLLGGAAGLTREDMTVPPDIQALAADLRKQYDPRRELDAYRAQLDQIQSRGLMGADTNAFVGRAWRDKLKEVGGRLGIDTEGRYQLPEATAVGTAEDARIITAWRTEGSRPQTAEGLLQQILTEIQRQNQIAERLPREIGREQPRPRVFQLPGE